MRFDVLGPLKIRRENVLLPVTGLKSRTIIACLALNPDELIDIQTLLNAGWESPPPRSAVHQVRKIVSTLRSNLGEGWDTIATFREGYMLKPPPELSDVVQFTRLYAQAMANPMATDEDLSRAYKALALWRGRPCEGSEPRGSDSRIAELLAQHRALLDRTLRAFGERGRCDELLAVVQTASRIHADLPDPLVGDKPADSPTFPEQRSAGATGPTGLGRASVRGGGSWCLPRDLRDFSGRADEVRQLVEWLSGSRSSAGLVTVHGMGGVGKSTLAVHVAHRIAPEFPDGQLFVNLGASVPSATLTVRDAAGILLSQLRVPDEDIPPSEQGRLARWRDLTARKRLLIVLDDAESAAQVESLLPASPSVCITTSRVDLHAIDAPHYLRLEVPPDHDCIAMLRGMLGDRRVDEEREQALELIRRFGNLPLALRLAAARLTTREFGTLSELLLALAQSASPADDLEVPGRSLVESLNMSLNSLDGTDLGAFLRLCLLPAPEFDEAAVAAGLGKDLDSARRVCRRLTDRALLQRVAAGAYRIHSQLAEAARAHIPSRVRVEEQRRVVADAMTYYGAAFGLDDSGRSSSSSIPRSDVLFATVRRSSELAGQLGLLPGFAELCLAWERPLTLYLDAEQQKLVWGLACEGARNHSEPLVRGRVLLAAARGHWHGGDAAAGLKSARRAWEEARRADDDLLRVHTLLWYSSFNWLCREVTTGVSHIARARMLLEGCGDDADEREIRRLSLEMDSNEAALRVQEGQFDLAAGLCRKVLDVADIDPRVRIMAGATLAESRIGTGQYGDALIASSAALREAERIRSPYGRALVLQQTAVALRALAKPREAVDAAERALSMASDVGSVRLINELTAFLDEESELSGCEEGSSAPGKP
ncbi:NB-ARC domain-containing protein [Amycolatopsis sp. FBCC-B4732]|uniref:AfsR/SARP family transcriptional regulator n=1 Tax=unclassified Amycolatopsis TaxID=2618356 RepID=UPI001FF21E1B|nr:NB-ARC domain-containing protein [Amycolatopsis sp. FBCC-B4732]UOX93089.1 NB-ARC domain-containing protein [Amycolatopsis sp. FBCC-B4732]